MMHKIYLFYTLFLSALLLSSNALSAQDFNQIIKTVAGDRAAVDRFGYSVAISGNYAIVGAFQEDEDAAGGNTLSAAGFGLHLERDGGGNWIQVQKIVAATIFCTCIQLPPPSRSKM